MKKYKYQIIILLLVLFNLVVVVKNQDKYIMSEYVMATTNQEKKLDVQDEHQYKMRVYYPTTDYDILNKEIANKMSSYVSNFKKDIEGIEVQPNQYYTLIILYDQYQYQDYISYVFYIEIYNGGAHPNHEIWTITYDTKNGKIVTIDDLITTNSDILNIFSDVSRKQLITNPDIVDMAMMMEGTKPIKENFSNFAFSKRGILLFFPQYQVAPYSSGSFVVTVPYQQVFN